MGKNQNRQKHVFREWLSDNLRYIGLGAGILAALMILFFAVRSISYSINGRTGAVRGNDQSTQTRTEHAVLSGGSGSESQTALPGTSSAVKEASVSGENPETSAAETGSGQSDNGSGSGLSETDDESGSETEEAFSEEGALSDASIAEDLFSETGSVTEAMPEAESSVPESAEEMSLFTGDAADTGSVPDSAEGSPESSTAEKPDGTEGVGWDDSSPDPEEEPAASVLSSAESAAESLAEEPGGTLLKDSVPEVTSLVAKYLDAISAQDVDAMASLTDFLSEKTRENVRAYSRTYSNVEVYTKEGYTDNSYIVYVVYDELKEGKSTALPNCRRWYVRRDVDGNWKIIHESLDRDTENYVEEVASGEDVQELLDAVKERRGEVLASLQQEEAEEEARTSAESAEAADDGDSGDRVSGSVGTAEETDNEPERDTTTVHYGTIRSDVFVRSGPGFEYGVIGELPGGTSVTLIGDDSLGWYHVRANGYDGYVGHSYIND